MTRPQPPQTVRWLNMRLNVPQTWEVVRHGVDPKNGVLILIDRHAQRLQWSWRQVPSIPDLGRMLDDYRSRDLQDHPDARFKDLAAGLDCAGTTSGGWRGARRLHQGKSVTRALRYEPALQRLIELVIPWPVAYEPDLERDLLASFAVDAPLEGPSRYSAFGLDVRVPPAWRLTRAEVEPARTVLCFSLRRSLSQITRYGAADDWYDGRPEAFLGKQLGRQRVDYQPASLKAHPALGARSPEDAPRWKHLIGRGRQRCDLVWHCPTDHAVYQVTTLAPETAPVEPRSFEVGCCPPQALSAGGPA